MVFRTWSYMEREEVGNGSACAATDNRWPISEQPESLRNAGGKLKESNFDLWLWASLPGRQTTVTAIGTELRILLQWVVVGMGVVFWHSPHPL
jgi:hypothetical protein